MKDRTHLFGIAALLMRQVLVEHVRARKTMKRNGEKVPIEDDLAIAVTDSEDLVALDEALDQLAAFRRVTIAFLR